MGSAINSTTWNPPKRRASGARWGAGNWPLPRGSAGEYQGTATSDPMATDREDSSSITISSSHTVHSDAMSIERKGNSIASGTYYGEGSYKGRRLCEVKPAVDTAT